MRSVTLLLWTIGFLFVQNVYACAVIQLQSFSLGVREFTAIPDESSRQVGLRTGRASYATSDSGSKMYLYHVILEGGVGRWVVSDVLGEQELAVGYVDSWAIMPTLVHSLDGNRKPAVWQLFSGERWTHSPEAFFQCINTDVESAFYLNVPGEPWFYSGFFVETGDVVSDSSVYSMVANSVKRYLYKVGNNWILSGVIGSTTGEAYVEDAVAKFPAEITNPLWYFGNGTAWSLHEVTVIAGNREATVVRNLHLHRRISSLPASQSYFEFPNGIAMPSVGLGTGGIPKKTSVSVIRNALRQGYRLLDLAREFRNEDKVSRIMVAGRDDPEIPLRNEMFLVSKVWPTHLGFHPTTREIYESMRALQTPYIDLYMINWPTCDSSIEWMHCETSDEPSANWKESWNALERAYAEGHISSIGVSNFNHHMLAEFDHFGTVLPHAVQNAVQPGDGRVDMRVREWCSLHDVIFMSRSTQIGFKDFPESLKSVIQSVASNHAVSPHAVISRFFLQSGAAIIPRSAKSAHLQENLKVLNFTLTRSEMKQLGWPHVMHSDEL